MKYALRCLLWLFGVWVCSIAANPDERSTSIAGDEFTLNEFEPEDTPSDEYAREAETTDQEIRNLHSARGGRNGGGLFRRLFNRNSRYGRYGSPPRYGRYRGGPHINRYGLSPYNHQSYGYPGPGRRYPQRYNPNVGPYGRPPIPVFR